MSVSLNFLKSRRLLWLPPVLVGAAVFGFFVSGKRELPRKERQEVALPIRVFEIVPTKIVPTITGFGTAGPSRKWAAVAEVSGRIVEANPQLETGNQIRAGELLFRIDPSDYELQLSQRESDLAVAKAALDETLASELADKRSLEIEKSLLAVSQTELDRQIGLQAKQIVSDSELESARMNLLMQQQAVQRLNNTLSLYTSRIASKQAQVKLAESRVAEARRNLDRTQARSPFSGTLAGVTVEVGQAVAPNQTLFELHDTSTVEVEAHFSIAQLQRVLPRGSGRYPPGDQLENLLPKLQARIIATSGSSAQRFVGRPLRVSESIDTQTRTLGIVIAVDNSIRKEPQKANDDSANNPPKTQSGVSSVLRAGTFCEIELRSQGQGSSIAVPRLALDGDAVYTIDSDNRLHRTEVVIESFMGDSAVIASGLQIGQRIASQPPVPAIDGMLVDPMSGD